MDILPAYKTHFEPRKSTAFQKLSQEAESRMPGPEWKGRTGTAGVTDDKRRGSPIVEISMLLV